MQVFLSWSGERSKAVAHTLEMWIVQVIQAAEPWISSDIDKGMRWAPEVADRLERSKVGIICLTRDNLESKWIHFEAGALSKTKDAHVCTFLLDVKPTDVDHPLAQFQHTTAQKPDVLQLVQTINRVVQKAGERALGEPVLGEAFETYWPRLEAALGEISSRPVAEAKPKRSESEMLEEVLELLRRQERQRAIEGNLQAALLEASRQPRAWWDTSPNPVLLSHPSCKTDPPNLYKQVLASIYEAHQRSIEEGASGGEPEKE